MTNISASLVYDSWIEPLPELRSAPSSDRHLIFEGAGLVLDLLLKMERGGASIHIGGQILPSEAGLDSVSGVPVLVEQAGRLTYTRTNALGEFGFQAEPLGAVDLSITLGERKFIVRGLSNNQPRSWRIVEVSAQAR